MAQINNYDGITTINYNEESQILFDAFNREACGIIVESPTTEGQTVTINNRKYVLAGMPIGNPTGLSAIYSKNIEDRSIEYPIAGTDGENVVGVLQHTVDVTNGPANGSMITHGRINVDRLADEVKAYYTANPVIKAELAKLGIRFLSDN